jgi:iron complex transport system substrate-binding protein
MKLKRMLPALLAPLFLLTFCSPKQAGQAKSGPSSPPALAAAQQEGVKRVKDMKGETEIPSEPRRLVDVSGSADELIILGIPFTGSANTSMFDGVTVPAYLGIVQ